MKVAPLLAGWVSVVSAGVWSGSVRAENVFNFNAQVNKRFVSGFDGGVVVTTPPVVNTSPNFLAAGYDLSGVGWNTQTDTGKNANSQNVAMVSPMNYAHANHFSISHGGDLTFLGNNDQLYFANSQSRVKLSSDENSDASLGKLTAPIPNSAHVTYYGVVDRGDTGSSYVGMPLLVYGWYGVIGATNVTSANWNADGLHSISFSKPNSIAVQGGDSGSPTLTPYNGSLTLAGTRYGTFGGFSGGVDTAWVDPFIVARANANMASSGYAMKVTALPTKTWDGGAGNGEFGSAENWAQGLVPDREGIAFDAAAANGQFNINLASTASVKGITFTPSASGGFTFAGSKFQLGTGGIINDSTQTQTFNNDIQFHYQIAATSAHDAVVSAAQHWTAANGNLIINGSVDTNGFQLVVDGDKDTAINGAILGGGGVGKEGTGKLDLTTANTYAGNTTLSNGTLAVNNTAGSGTGGGNVNVWAGRLQGTGSIAGSVTFRDNSDPMTLAPGNADLGQTGRLTVHNGVTLSSRTTLQLHLGGLVAGSDYDQLLVTSGNVDLGLSTLDLIAGDFATTDASRFWLVNLTGAGLLFGQFAGLDNGDLVGLIGGNAFHIYYGADFASDALTGGNDVLLAAVPEPASLTVLALFVLVTCQRRRKQSA